MNDFESEYDDDSQDMRPTPELVSLAEKEVTESYQVTNLERIGLGAYGYVYKGKYKGVDVVVKISSFANTKSILKQGPKIREILLQHLHEKNATKSNVANQQRENEQQFFTEDHVFHSKRHKGIIYHIMEYLSSRDMQMYLEDTATVLSFKELMKIFCSMLQAMQFFHESKLIFNDLKLENVLVDPKHMRVVLIDYIDSCTECTQLECTDANGIIVKTFGERRTGKPSIAEDIWRIALTILDAIHLYTVRNMDDMPANAINFIVQPNKDYPTEKIKEIIKKEVTCLQTAFPNDIDNDKKESLCNMLGRMLHAKPVQRPLITDILNEEPFNVCNQKDYKMHRIQDTRVKSKEAAKRLSEAIKQKHTPKRKERKTKRRHRLTRTSSTRRHNRTHTSKRNL